MNLTSKSDPGSKFRSYCVQIFRLFQLEQEGADAPIEIPRSALATFEPADSAVKPTVQASFTIVDAGAGGSSPLFARVCNVRVD